MPAAMSAQCAPPEPSLTPEKMVERAAALRPLLFEEQEASDKRGYFSNAVQEKLLEGGFYRALQPKSFGGYEFDFSVYIRSIMEIARGHPGAGWCYALAASHAYVLAAHWPEEAQRDFFGKDGDFRSAMVLGASGTLKRAKGGYVLDGAWPFCSGIPVSNHFMGNALIADSEPEAGLFVIARDKLAILPDWGGEMSLGMQASGSNSVKIEGQFLPEHHVVIKPLRHVMMASPREGTFGTKLHGNAMYLGVLLGWFHCEFGAILSGTARAALEEYERILRTKVQTFDPLKTRMHDHDNQRPLGEAMSLADSAEALTLAATAAYSELGKRWAATGAPIELSDTLRVWGMARNACVMACEAVEKLFYTAGASVGTHGQRLQRYFRDVQMYRVHIQSSPIWPTLRGAHRLGLTPASGPTSML